MWTWGKMGSLLVFMGVMLMMLTAYTFVSASAQSDGANQVSRTLKNLVLDTYNSVGEMSLEYKMPENIDGQPYSVEVLDKGNTIGIITRTSSGPMDLIGGSSLEVPLSNLSFGTLKGFHDRLHYICIVKHNGKVYLERSRCS